MDILLTITGFALYPTLMYPQAGPIERIVICLIFFLYIISFLNEIFI